ncbi:hypothetical protein Hdeb2414_s0009g00318941 [Helianthus debilis subsp. tardiflorus]
MKSSDVELEQQIKEIGKQLSHPPDSAEELLTLLDVLMSVFYRTNTTKKVCDQCSPRQR